MTLKRTILIINLILIQTFAQIDGFKELDYDKSSNLASYQILPIVFNDHLKLFSQSGNIIYEYTSDLQLDSLSLIGRPIQVRIPATDNAFSVTKSNDNVFIANIDFDGNIYFSFSNDKGISFNTNSILESNVTANKIDLSITNDQLLILSLVKDNAIVNYTSNDDGVNWNGPYTIQNFVDSLSYAQTIEFNGTLTAIVSRNEGNVSGLFTFTSLDSGKTWQNEKLILMTQQPITKFQVIKDNNQKIYIAYNKILQNNVFSISQTDVFYISSTDGENWTEEIQFTKYLKDDDILGSCLYNSMPLLITNSTRYGYNKVKQYASIITEAVDEEPPAVFDVKYKASGANANVSLKVYADDLDGIESIKVNIKGDEYTLFDNGVSSDSTANDNIFGTTLATLSNLTADKALLSINNLHFPFTNAGEIGIVDGNFNIPMQIYVVDNKLLTSNFTESITKEVDDLPYIRFNDYINAPVVFCGGFYLSGYDGQELWVNGVASASLTEDYVPGTINATPSDPSTKIYSVFRDDPDFGNSWQSWKDAVDAGAYFYDGDGDGEYNPVDLNQNGSWDVDEDKPDLLYDATYYTVYNDAVPSEDRNFNTVSPKGIEIRQTSFASAQNSLLNNVVFVRYSLLYKGMESQADTLNNVIFSFWNDSDIGDYTDDLTGTDTTLNSVFSYNDGPDNGSTYLGNFGVNPPAPYFTLVQGPRKYTEDQNDIAYNRLGPDLGTKEFVGYKNLNMISSMSTISADPDVGHAGMKEELRDYQLGKTKGGNSIDPCEWPYSEVFGQSCELIDPVFWYSGDPVTNTGWLFTTPSDVRQMLSTGTFDLVKDEPVDIIVAYSAERGIDELNSITKTRQTVSYIHEEYEKNFSTLVGVDENNESITQAFLLSQNYPNPFNPTSKIKYQIAKLSKVELRVYDILGQEITTLVNKVQSPGNYEVTFNGSQLASGVYFYRLAAGDFVQTKKMLLIK